MDPSLTGFYRVGQKLNDVIQVLRITPTATEPSTVSVFLSVASSAVAYYAGHRPAHILALSHPGWPVEWVSTGWAKKFEKNRIFDHFENVRPYISATVINRGT